MGERNLTAVLICYRKNRLNHRLIFGAPAFEIRRGWHRAVAVFRTGQIFAYERWNANQYGTQDWKLFVCCAVQAGQITPVSGIHPGANVLLQARGTTQVKRALAATESLKKTHKNLVNITPAYWRHLHNSLATGTSAHAFNSRPVAAITG